MSGVILAVLHAPLWRAQEQFYILWLTDRLTFPSIMTSVSMLALHGPL